MANTAATKELPLQGDTVNLNDYQQAARTTAVYPPRYRVIYPAMGLAGEAGETIEKVKKAVRKSGDHSRVEEHIDIDGIIAEMGDVLWYLANLATDLAIPLSVIAEKNLAKLSDRAQRGVIKGEGDKR